MVVICNVQGCQYKTKSNFCKRRVVNLNGGQCDYIKKMVTGKVEQPIYLDGYYKKQQETKLDLIQKKEDAEAGAMQDLSGDREEDDQNRS